MPPTFLRPSRTLVKSSKRVGLIAGVAAILTGVVGIGGYLLIKQPETISGNNAGSNTTITSKATGVNYTRLQELLEARKWKEADQETTRMMLQAAGREKEGWFRGNDLNKFSCEDLGIIDKLWLDSSQEKFGFSVQKEIWQRMGSPTIDAKIQVWRKFYIDVGWKTKESGVSSDMGYISYNDLGGFQDFDTSTVGNLPFWRWRGGRNWGILFSRCEL